MKLYFGRNSSAISQLEKIIVYCFGFCEKSELKFNKAGWGFIVINSHGIKEYHGGEPKSTKERIEIIACLKVLEKLSDFNNPIIIHCISDYLVKSSREEWYFQWKKNGWRSTKKYPLECPDLMKQLARYLVSKKRILVKTQPDSEWILKAEMLARKGIAELEHEISFTLRDIFYEKNS